MNVNINKFKSLRIGNLQKELDYLEIPYCLSKSPASDNLPTGNTDALVEIGILGCDYDFIFSSALGEDLSNIRPVYKMPENYRDWFIKSIEICDNPEGIQSDNGVIREVSTLNLLPYYNGENEIDFAFEKQSEDYYRLYICDMGGCNTDIRYSNSSMRAYLYNLDIRI